MRITFAVCGSPLLIFLQGKIFVNAFSNSQIVLLTPSRHLRIVPPCKRPDHRGSEAFSNVEHDNNRRNICSLVSFTHVDERPRRLDRVQNKIQRAFSDLWWWPKDETAKWRTAAAMFISSIVLFQPFLDQQLAKLWTYLATSPNMIATAFRHDHWEWMLAVAAFACYIHFYWLADRAVLKAGENGRVHPWRKFRLQDRLEAQNHHRNRLVQSENGIDVNLNEQPPLVTPQSPWNRKGWIFELWVYVVPLFVLDRLYPRRALRLSMFGPPTAFTICRDVSCGLLLYDFFFFCGHVLMHRLPFLWGIHKKHHEVLEVRAGDVVRLSLAEEVLEVLMSVVALTLLKAHPISRSIYNCIIVFLLTELHSGFDFPWSPQNVVPFGLATGSRRHHYHHRYGTHYYQKFFHSFDRLFGFFQPNDGSIRGDSVLPVKKLPSSWATANS